jgi:hypothetical protein
MRYIKHFAGFALAVGMALSSATVVSAADWREARYIHQEARRDYRREARYREEMARERFRHNERRYDYDYRR